MKHAALQPRPTPAPAIGLLEVATVSAGYACADRVVKAAAVDLALCEPVTPGKFLVLFAGRVEEVVSSLRAGIEGLGEHRIDHTFLPGVHADLVPALRGTREVDGLGALGVLECRTVSGLLAAADAVAKQGEVELLRIRAAVRLGGRAFCTFTGSVDQVESACAAGLELADRGGGDAHSVVIPRPHPQLHEYLR